MISPSEVVAGGQPCLPRTDDDGFDAPLVHMSPFSTLIRYSMEY